MTDGILPQYVHVLPARRSGTAVSYNRFTHKKLN